MNPGTFKVILSNVQLVIVGRSPNLLIVTLLCLRMWQIVHSCYIVQTKPQAKVATPGNDIERRRWIKRIHPTDVIVHSGFDSFASRSFRMRYAQ